MRCHLSVHSVPAPNGGMKRPRKPKIEGKVFDVMCQYEVKSLHGHTLDYQKNVLQASTFHKCALLLQLQLDQDAAITDESTAEPHRSPVCYCLSYRPDDVESEPVDICTHVRH